MKSNYLLYLKTIKNKDNGSLSIFESNRDIPFVIKRIYFIYKAVKNTLRGFHAHKTLTQLLWCPHGEIKVLVDNGKTKKWILLDSPNKAIIIHPYIWHEMQWVVDDSVLCVAASDYYDESDYIRDYKIFLNYINSPNLKTL